MKVLFLVATFPALSETFILNQITGFIDAGHEVEIVACQRATNKKHHPDVEKYRLMSKVTFIDIPTNFSGKLIKGLQVLMGNVVKHPRLCMEMMRFKKYGKFTLSLRPLLFVPFFSKDNSWDAIICHYGSNGLIATMFQQQGKVKGKVMTFFHGNDITGFVRKFGNDIYNPLFQSKTLLLPISNLWKEKLIDLGANSRNTRVHHMGVDLSKFNYVPIESQDFIDSSISILLVGRLTAKKGIDIAIESINQLKEKGINVSLTVIGDGEEKKQLQDMIKQLNLENQVTLKGWLTQEEVNQHIEKSTLIILPSRTASNGDMEGIPVSLMEAMARGKLVISTYHSGIPELIKDEYNGWLVPENNSSALANKIEEVINKKELWNNISNNARKTIQKEFNINLLNQKLIKIIEKE
ncbi:colanic acid biosynthesis glycosyltransferase WcaL [Bacillus cereus]|nr:colanic acid biosynthesis glycosyltransferase WcaL [Bacillus cereus]